MAGVLKASVYWHAAFLCWLLCLRFDRVVVERLTSAAQSKFLGHSTGVVRNALFPLDTEAHHASACDLLVAVSASWSGSGGRLSRMLGRAVTVAELWRVCHDVHVL